jgi:hypothetical protein
MNLISCLPIQQAGSKQCWRRWPARQSAPWSVPSQGSRSFARKTIHTVGLPEPTRGSLASLSLYHSPISTTSQSSSPYCQTYYLSFSFNCLIQFVLYLPLHSGINPLRNHLSSDLLIYSTGPEGKTYHIKEVTSLDCMHIGLPDRS